MTQNLDTNIGTRPALAAGTYRIDAARSRVRFTIKETFGLMTTSGTFAVQDGAVVIATVPEESTATANLSADSFTTDKARRDKNIVSKRFLDADRHPTIRFTGTRLTRSGGSWVLDGTLTVRGESCPVSLTLASAAATVDGCRFTATGRVDRYATPVRGARGIIGRYLDVELDVYAVARG